MDDNDELEFVEEDYYAFLNVPRNVSYVLIDDLRCKYVVLCRVTSGTIDCFVI